MLRKLLSVGLALALVSALVWGKGKPGGKPGGDTPSGTIYITLGSDLYTMDADGGNKTALLVGVLSLVRGGAQPSHDLHGGHRWFLDYRAVTGTYPDGRPRRELFAVRDDGGATQLTDQAALDLGWQGSPFSVRWAPDDSEISFIARRWDGSAVIEAGIYAAEIDYNAAGEIVGLVAQPAMLVETDLIDLGGTRGWFPGIDAFDWSPDGNKIVHNTALASGGVASELTVVDLGTGAATTFSTSDVGGGPVWSPDGSKIAFGGGYDLWTIAPDGTGESLTLRRKGGRRPVNYAGPQWSPTGSHLIVQGWGDILGGGRQDVYRAAADGSGKTNLTAEIDTTLGNGGTPAGPVAWR